jgi:hypothetical protein
MPQARPAGPQVRPSTGLKALLALLRPFASRKAGRKVVAVESLTGIEAATRCRAPLRPPPVPRRVVPLPPLLPAKCGSAVRAIGYLLQSARLGPAPAAARRGCAQARRCLELLVARHQASVRVGVGMTPSRSAAAGARWRSRTWARASPRPPGAWSRRAAPSAPAARRAAQARACRRSRVCTLPVSYRGISVLLRTGQEPVAERRARRVLFEAVCVPRAAMCLGYEGGLQARQQPKHIARRSRAGRSRCATTGS